MKFRTKIGTAVLIALSMRINTYAMSADLVKQAEVYSKASNISPIIGTALVLESGNLQYIDDETILQMIAISESNITKYNNAELAYISGNNKNELNEIRRLMRNEIRLEDLSLDTQERIDNYKLAKKIYEESKSSKKNENELNWFINRDLYKNIRITSQFAYRSGGMHRALDIGTSQHIGENGNKGELNVYPVKEGRVVRIERDKNRSTGLAVWYEIELDGDTYNISYMHLSLLGNIQVGDVVSKETVLGTVGETGDAYGIHLHIQVDRNGERVNPLRLFGFDPSWDKETQEKWFDTNGVIVNCTEECLLANNENNQTGEFAVVRCKNHR